jgi:hypothetical protein
MKNVFLIFFRFFGDSVKNRGPYGASCGAPGVRFMETNLRDARLLVEACWSLAHHVVHNCKISLINWPINLSPSSRLHQLLELLRNCHEEQTSPLFKNCRPGGILKKSLSLPPRLLASSFSKRRPRQTYLVSLFPSSTGDRHRLGFEWPSDMLPREPVSNSETVGVIFESRRRRLHSSTGSFRCETERWRSLGLRNRTRSSGGEASGRHFTGLESGSGVWGGGAVGEANKFFFHH